MEPAEHILTLDCPESPGIVAAVSRFLLDHGSDIIDNHQFGDRRDGHFFMRVRFAAPGGEDTTELLRREFTGVAAPFAMRWHLEPVGTRRRVLIMVSRYDHCLNDLLFRTRSGDLPIDVGGGGGGGGGGGRGGGPGAGGRAGGTPPPRPPPPPPARGAG
ncbi:ACT domain-containing protein, partial [Streptomyces massasporeus]|uniref:ACT domain-containing protein n=1 Tax=Streptomyces massasporeus TaxID=67324 RepID=UPI0037AE87E2